MPGRVSERGGIQWAASLQDGTLQGLAAMRLVLASAVNEGSHEALERAAELTIQQLDDEIGDLRALITLMRSEPVTGSFGAV